MKGTITVNQNLIIFGIPLSLLAVLILLMKFSFPAGNDLLDLAITLDLLLTVPLIYFLLIRKKNIPNTTVVPFIIAGLAIGTYFLPQERQFYLVLFKTWILPVMEISILAYVVIKVRGSIQKIKGLKSSSPDFFTALKSTCSEVLPEKLVLPFATEIAVFYYGFIHWKSKVTGENEYTYHKKSGTRALFGALILVMGVEALALHFLLSRWSNNAAWILTIISIYTAIQVFGFAKSLSKRPIVLDNQKLLLKYGILNDAEIFYSDIESVNLTGKELEKDEMTRTLSPLGAIESHNVVIHLKQENTLIGLYGIKKKFKVIGFHIDDPEKFKRELEVAINNGTY